MIASPARIRAVATVVLAALVGVADPTARAEPAPDTTPRPTPTIQIGVIGGPAALRWARSLVGPRNFGGATPKWNLSEAFDSRALLATAGDSAPNVIRAWLDLSEPRRARLYFAARSEGRSGERFLIRDVELSGAFDAIDHESLAEVLELSVAALIEDDRAGLSRAETEALLSKRPPTTTTVPAPPRASSGTAAAATTTGLGATLRLDSPGPPAVTAAAPTPAAPAPFGSPAKISGDLAIFYAAAPRSSSLPLAHGPGLVGTLGWNLERWRTAGWVSGQYQWSSQEQPTDLGLGVRLAALATRAGVEVDRRLQGPEAAPRAAHHVLRGRVGAGLDFVHITPFSGMATGTTTLAPSRWSTAVVVTAAGGDAWWISPHAYVAASVTVDVAPVAVDYQVNVDGRVTSLFSTWRVRPGFAIELGL